MLTKKWILCLVPAVFLLAVAADASVKYIKYDGREIVEVPSERVRNACGYNFIYRDVNKDDVDPYLEKPILKAAFTGALISQLDIVIDRLKKTPGMCSWVSLKEFGKW